MSEYQNVYTFTIDFEILLTEKKNRQQLERIY